MILVCTLLICGFFFFVCCHLFVKAMETTEHFTARSCIGAVAALLSGIMFLTYFVFTLFRMMQ